MQPKFDAVIFDMDGTLVESMLDFRAVRAELGIPPTDGIIEAIDAMEGQRKRRATDQLVAWELAGAKRAELIPGAAETVRRVRAAGLKTALLTRNAKCVMDMILDKFALEFDLAWSRQCAPANKPLPDGNLAACRELGAAPDRTVCVGDFRYDIVAANAAGSVSVLLARKDDRPEFADEADFVITELPDLLGILGIDDRPTP